MPKRTLEDSNTTRKNAAEHSDAHTSKKSRVRIPRREGTSSKAVPSFLNDASNNERKASKQQRNEEKRKQKNKKRLDQAAHSEQEVVALSQEPLNQVDNNPSPPTDSAQNLSTGPTSNAENEQAKPVRRAKKRAKGHLTTSDTGVDSAFTINGVVAGPQPSAHSPNRNEPEAKSDVGGTTTRSYTQHLELSNIPQTDVDTYLSSNSISIFDPLGSALPFRPITSFSYLPTGNELLSEPFKGFPCPTPIQAAAWPFLLSGRDVIGVAQTGSGKTLAFALPCIRHVLKSKNTQKKTARGPRAVVVSPTRELALQIYEQMTKVAAAAGEGVACLYGGVGKDEQKKSLRTASIVVATPGRLNDLICEGAADLSNVDYLVLDEADRMLDTGSNVLSRFCWDMLTLLSGFEQDVRKIIEATSPRPGRQTLMFTATWPTSVQKLAATFMTSPVKISIGDDATGELRANTSISQTVEVIDSREKEKRMLQLLKQHQSGKQKDDRILVFCLYKKEATRVENFIRSKDYRVAGIHGDLSQAQRFASLDSFKSGRTPILVATDVAARGLDIPAVKVVINVTFPLTVEDYVHRIGR